jgi:EAL domain-containing protein (putative c-di-GMP-specific phosphodiesterase class I)
LAIFYTDIAARHRLSIEGKLRRALACGEFYLNYQPIVGLTSGRIVAAEALLRWRNPELGLISPDQFIPIAEETGLIVSIGNWVIETVCRDLATWSAQGLPLVRVPINISSRQLADRALVGVVAQALAANQLSAACIELEVTERLLLEQSPRTIDLLGELRAMGLRLSIDDFGTGYSSMSYLTSFPFDVLKIDRSFIAKVTERSQDGALTQAIVAMAHSLDLEVVAEGVETVGQMTFLQRTGCDFAQGYLFARPLAADGFAKLLKDAVVYCGLGASQYTFALSP